MTPKSIAKGLRKQSPKYASLTDEQFEALWYRQTRDEFHATKGAFLEEERKAEEEAKKAEAAAAGA
jgi:hypothetical protein